MKRGISRPYQDQSRRADVYEQFLLGKSSTEAAKELFFPIYYCNEVYREFITNATITTSSRVAQIKSIEKELWESIEHKESPVKIDRLQNSYAKFCL